MAASHWSTAQLGQRERRLRDNEVQKEKIQTHLQQDRLYQIVNGADERVDTIRRIKALKAWEEEARIQAEREAAVAQQAAEEAAWAAAEEAAAAAAQRREAELCDTKMRQAIRENSPELRRLRQQIDTAYTQKERALQIEEHQLRQVQGEVADQELARMLEEQLRFSDEKQILKERDAEAKAKAYKSTLQEQLVDNERRREEEAAAFLREKDAIDAMVARILEDEAKQAMLKFQKQNETKNYIQSYLRQREAWQEAEKRRQEEENKQIAEYAHVQQSRQESYAARREEIEKRKEDIYQRLATEMDAAERSKNEMEDLRIALALEEDAYQAKLAEERQLARRITQRLQLVEAHFEQLAYKQARLDAEREADTQIRREMMDRFAADERIEQMTAQKRRMKQAEHKEAVEKMIQERIARREAEQRSIDEARRSEREVEALRAQIVEQERQRLLLEHAEKLRGYLPKGVFRDRAELARFDAEFAKTYGQVDASEASQEALY